MKVINKTLAIVITVSLTLLAGELGLRIITKALKLHFMYVYSDKQRVTYTLDENGSPLYVNGFKTYINTGIKPQFALYDKDGFRVSERMNFDKKGIKIGIFGDSTTENLQVPENKTYPRLLQKKLNPKDIFVFNFAVGGTGTYQQYKRYLTVKDKIKLDYIILACLPKNDILDNHHILAKPYEEPYSNYMIISEGKFIETNNTVKQSKDLFIIKWLRKYSYIANLFGKIRLEVRRMCLSKKIIQPYELYQKGGSRYTWLGAFGEPLNKDWQDAWKITDECILRMRGAVEKEGSVFILMLLTDSLQVDPPYDKLDGQYDFEYPNRRLRKFAERNNIRYIDTYEAFMEKKKELAYPYFGWEYDNHYSEIGTEFVSDLLADYFKQENS